VKKKKIEFKVNEDYSKWCFRLDVADYGRLEKSIKKNGIKTELHVLPDGTILCGHHRYEIAKKLGIPDEKIPYKIIDLPNEYDRLLYLIDDNLSRRQLNLAQKIRLGTQYEEIEKVKAKQRQKEHGGTAPGKEKDTSGNISQSDTGRARDKVGEKIGVSGKLYDMGKTVMEENPEDFKRAEAGEVSISKLYSEIQEEKAKKKIQEMKESWSRINTEPNPKNDLREIYRVYYEGLFEFGEALVDALSNFEFITKEEFMGGEEINLTKITKSIIDDDYFIDEKDKSLELLKNLTKKMENAIKSCKKILKYNDMEE